MKGHAEIAKVRIEVHAEGVPQTETQKRADAVRDFLVEQGRGCGALDRRRRRRWSVAVDFIIDAAAAKPAAPAPAGRARGPRRGAAGPSPPTPAAGKPPAAPAQPPLRRAPGVR